MYASRPGEKLVFLQYDEAEDEEWVHGRDLDHIETFFEPEELFLFDRKFC